MFSRLVRKNILSKDNYGLFIIVKEKLASMNDVSSVSDLCQLVLEFIPLNVIYV